MPRNDTHNRARSYSLYAAAGIATDRDCPLKFLAGFPGQSGSRQCVTALRPLVEENRPDRSSCSVLLPAPVEAGLPRFRVALDISAQLGLCHYLI